MFGKKKNFIKSLRKYEDKALAYIDNQKKTSGLLQQALKKANMKKRALGESWGNLQLFIELLKAYSKGEYRNVSKGTIITVIGAILYFVSPLDLVPDFILGLGFIDDAAVLGFTVKRLSKELNEFKRWKSTILTFENPLD
ncbi:MAG TPA: YkvA family protein [Neobacillus sp.]